MDAERVKINRNTASEPIFVTRKSRLAGVDLADHLACHLAAIHPSDDKWSFASICRFKTGKMSDHRRRLPQLLSLARKRAEEGGDLYVSLQTFRSGQSRETENLRALHSLYVDIDYYKAEKTAGMSGFEVMELVFDRIQELGRPTPSLVVDSGRGLQFVWTHQPLPTYALARWQACQRQLCEDFEDLGADPIAKDASRVFRLAGTINSKSGRKTSLLHFDKENSGFPRDFNDLANAILPFSRAEIRSLRAEAAERGRPVRLTKNGTSRVIPKLDASTFGDALLSDVFKLISLRYPDGQLPAGERDKYFFIAALAAAWNSHPGAIQDTIVSMATRMSSWTEDATKQAISCVLNRAEAAMNGQRIEFAGKLVDPRYRMKAETVIEWLSISEDEMRDADLRLAVSDDLKKERRRKAAEIKRRSEGRRTQAEVSEERMRLARQVERLIDSGRTQTQVAKALRLSQGQVSRLLKAARAAGPASSAEIEEVAEMGNSWAALRLIAQVLPMPDPVDLAHRRRSSA
jgi:hypothetical protein